MSGFFEHRRPSPPASWWTSDLSAELEGSDAAEEEAAFASGRGGIAGPDVAGHDAIGQVAPLLSEAGLDRDTQRRFAEALATMLRPADAALLMRRRMQAAASDLCPAGLLFASPRPGGGGGEAESTGIDDWPSPIAIEPRDTGGGVTALEAGLLRAAIANLAGRPASALHALDEASAHTTAGAGAAGTTGPIARAAATADATAGLTEREREAAGVLNEETASLRFGYHRVLAHVRGDRPLNADELASAIASLDAASPWRWAALRLALPQLQADAPDVAERLLS